ncbi:cobyric acid synthase [Microvirga pudoricolor]|uniref:cobyric acid synthase n=1 Tax=Microvirga pudoricolor TaxID=2778729 RepID=UPI0019515E8D|nr:cobyric acid synthase [Microvirga pudoricolor]MBM6592972.1 cobyric acid synthase [Microvirga pudoricolor]
MPRTAAVMIQGTGSNVGKSLLVAGLCRLFADRGLKVRPFKPQNMSNNAAAVEGGEIGRAQALQARAARVDASVHMNPVLLKPESDRRSQVIVQGKRHGQLDARAYRERASLMPYVLDSFARLGQGADLIVVEGAGSPAETNLRGGDIANMGFATAAGVPVVLAGDIDRGGVIASLVGTHAVLSPGDRAMVWGFLVNKFRGDPALFREGLDTITGLTGWPSLGIAPWFGDAHRLPAEDALDIASKANDGAALKVAVPILPRIANFDDLDPLKLDPAIALAMVPGGTALPGDADLIILPGSKSTMADLAFLKAQGWDIDIKAHVRRGGRVLGLCGGYQMLGRRIADPDGIEGPAGAMEGLGLLAVETVLSRDKTVRPVSARHGASGLPVAAYEIHLGRTDGEDTRRAPFVRDGQPEGAASPDGRIVGTYLHGLFSSDAFRAAFLNEVKPTASFRSLRYEDAVDRTLDDLAAHLGRHLDIEGLLRIARGGPEA